ncbi:dihydrouridine synthase-domain-containing protein [Xylogone sp. PMI_703]|nr:dihydrouridine synthase-domain-containing protein [Xylogone sp. PMI_703]
MTMAAQSAAAPEMLDTTSISSSVSDATQASPNVPTKLHGRKFYESIGSPKFVIAPMVDQSEFAWRMLTRSFMTPTSNKSLLAYTPMMHARMFGETAKFRDKNFQPIRAGLSEVHKVGASFSESELYLDGNPKIDRPLFVQFCANDPEEFLRSASYVAPFCDAVDLNLGCPQGIARKGKYGAFLQEDPDLICRMINKLHVNLSVPITAKIRILDTKEKTLEYARKVLNAGASILTVHGRQREQKGHNTGVADWSVIRYLRDNLPKETVLFANGNILVRGDIDRCLEVTGADAVMSAEGNLYDPAIFSDPPPVGEEGREYWRGKDGKGGYRLDAALRRYLDIIYKYVLEVPVPERKPLYLPSDPEQPEETVASDSEMGGPPKKKQRTDNPKEKKEKTSSPNLVAMQAHLFRLLRPLVSKHTHIRDALSRARAGDIEAFENILQMVEKVVAAGLKEYVETDGKAIEEEMENDLKLIESKLRGEGNANGVEPDEKSEGSLQTVRECRRPWWVAQPYVRPLPSEALLKGSMTLSKKKKAELQDVEKTQTGGVNLSGKTELERVGDGKEMIDVPKQGLVCG